MVKKNELDATCTFDPRAAPIDTRQVFPFVRKLGENNTTRSWYLVTYPIPHNLFPFYQSQHLAPTPANHTFQLFQI